MATERITDPQRIRALAHPLRLELLDLLGDVELTATECAERTGESVASCSFHLRMLAKYGFVEPAQRRGREKPWKLVSRSRDVRPDFDQPGSARALGMLGALFVEHSVEHVRAWIDQMPDEPPRWVDSSTICSSAFWATSDELAEISAQLQNIGERFADRVDDPSLRPAGSRPIRVFATANPDVARQRGAQGDM